jgi:hypothetical protein
MLDDLYKREMYGSKLSEKMEVEGSIAVSIANRLALGCQSHHHSSRL